MSALLLYGMVTLVGMAVFSYFYWQAHYCFRFRFSVLLSLAGVGLLIYLCGLGMLLSSIIGIRESTR